MQEIPDLGNICSVIRPYYPPVNIDIHPA
jgi:hypothetical protein